MNIVSIRGGFLCLMLMFTTWVWASEGHGESAGKESDKESEVKAFIQHHLKDSHSLDFYEKDGAVFGFPLPVILWDNGLKIFSSSKFCNASSTAKSGGDYYTLYHGKIYKTNQEGHLTLDAEHHPTEPKVLDFSITKNVIYIVLAAALMLWMFIGMAKRYKKSGFVPKGLSRFLEPIVLYVRDEIAIPNIGPKKYKKYLPYLLTVFFFIWILNLLGMSPLGVNVTGNIVVTVVLAVFTFLLTNLTGTKTYWMHLLDPLGNSMPWYGKVFLYPLLVPIELLGIFIKPFSLFIRLFANMTAGHIIVMSLIAAIWFIQSWIGGGLTFVLTFFIMIIEFFVAALQAYIFTMLSAMYFGMAAEEGHEH